MTTSHARIEIWLLGAFLILASCLIAPAALEAGEAQAASAFDSLKGLEGTWKGEAKGEGEIEPPEAEQDMKPIHEFRVSANGSVVMETMNPGTSHEMINMYHLDGDELLLTHYCAGGNQPHMKLNREVSSDTKLQFDFTGGTNLDPAVDEHIHSALVTIMEDGTLNSSWTAYGKGKEVAKMHFALKRTMED